MTERFSVHSCVLCVWMSACVNMYVCVYAYMYVCICVCVSMFDRKFGAIASGLPGIMLPFSAPVS